MNLQTFFHEFGVRPDSCAACALATDGFGSKAHVLMVAMHTFDEHEKEITCFVSGGDPVITQRYHGIPKQVYDSMAVDPTVVAEVMKRKLAEMGIHHLICIQAHRFVRARMQEAKLVDNTISFIDIALIHKALGFWTGNLQEAHNLIDLQGKIERMRGKNLFSLDTLAEDYGVGKREPPSPYIPYNKAWQVREIFQKQLETELPF